MNESIVESCYQVKPNVSSDQTEQESSRIDGNATKITEVAEGIIPVMEDSESDSGSGKIGAKNADVPKSPVVTEDIVASNSKNLNSSNIICEGNEQNLKIQKSKVNELITILKNFIVKQSKMHVEEIQILNEKRDMEIVRENTTKMYLETVISSPERPSSSKGLDSRSESPSVSSEDSFPSNKVYISQKFPIEMEQQERTDSSPINIPVSAPAPTDSMNESIVESGYQVEPNVSCDQIEQESSRIDGNESKITEVAEGIIPLMEALKSDSDSGESGAKNKDFLKYPVVTEDIAASNSKNLSSSNVNFEGNEELKPKIQKSKVDELEKTLEKLVEVQSLIQYQEANDKDDMGVVLKYIIQSYPKPAVASPVGSSISKSSDSKSESPSVSSEDSFPSNKVHISEKTAEIKLSRN